jgi:RecA-family ATPase
MDKLAPKLIRRAQQKKYKAVVIDPIYKVITGDENSAEAMSHFCNQFDKICNEIGAAVIDCHHHSKGAQGGKRSADRASGSGVFARDPDALVDLIELDAEEAKKALENRTVCDAMTIAMCDLTGGSAWRDDIPMDDTLEEKKFLAAARKLLDTDQAGKLLECMVRARAPLEAMSAWRLEGTLREFAAFKPRNIWFRYPIHLVEEHMLNEAEPDGMEAPWEKKRKKKDKSKTDRKIERKEAFFEALESCQEGGGVATMAKMEESMGISTRTLRRYLTEFGYSSESGLIAKIEGGKNHE